MTGRRYLVQMANHKSEPRHWMHAVPFACWVGPTFHRLVGAGSHQKLLDCHSSSLLLPRSCPTRISSLPSRELLNPPGPYGNCWTLDETGFRFLCPAFLRQCRPILFLIHSRVSVLPAETLAKIPVPISILDSDSWETIFPSKRERTSLRIEVGWVSVFPGQFIVTTEQRTDLGSSWEQRIQ